MSINQNNYWRNGDAMSKAPSYKQVFNDLYLGDMAVEFLRNQENVNALIEDNEFLLLSLLNTLVQSSSTQNQVLLTDMLVNPNLGHFLAELSPKPFEVGYTNGSNLFLKALNEEQLNSLASNINLKGLNNEVIQAFMELIPKDHKSNLHMAAQLRDLLVDAYKTQPKKWDGFPLLKTIIPLNGLAKDEIFNPEKLEEHEIYMPRRILHALMMYDKGEDRYGYWKLQTRDMDNIKDDVIKLFEGMNEKLQITILKPDNIAPFGNVGSEIIRKLRRKNRKISSIRSLDNEMTI